MEKILYMKKTKILSVILMVGGIVGILKNLNSYQPSGTNLKAENVIIGLSVLSVLIGITLWYYKKRKKSEY